MADNIKEVNSKVHITQWIQISTAILTMLASFGLWIVHTAGTPSIEVQEVRSQITELSKELVSVQLENERLKVQIENIERIVEHENADRMAR